MASRIGFSKKKLGFNKGSPQREALIARLVASLKPVKVNPSLRVQ